MSLQAAAAAAAADVQNRPARLPMQVRQGPLPVQPPMRPAVIVDREKTCPLLLRVFTKHGNHHDVEEFAERGKEPADEVQIYTWKDATLRELTDLVKEVAPLARRRDARLSFAFIYPNRRGRNVIRKVGSTFSGGRKTPDDTKSLEELSFQTGDFLDVAIYA
eukprot:TRINITY_DN1315_c0_g1_i2.p2 TRINITY_DN1315_c0_g1~~TRINITY_DN1315_c0_g1_i2.p2  ORF type:complete len:162 (-),score=45.94 TRINITY_DN1315_c0_g1_i2:929-1414(-)